MDESEERECVVRVREKEEGESGELIGHGHFGRLCFDPP